MENNGDIGRQSDFDNGNKGSYYGITHKFAESDFLEIVYKDQMVISSSQNNPKLEAIYSLRF